MAAKSYCRILDGDKVSTHSHPKVAACLVYLLHHYKLFQHTATRRWLLSVMMTFKSVTGVSTHSHPKVAASRSSLCMPHSLVSTHSHPKVAAVIFCLHSPHQQVSTHSHPKVAATVFTDAKAALVFQHTATRRWLHQIYYSKND